MARNEEKQLGRLNRLYLQRQKEEQVKKKPPRPKLETLHTASEIQKWLPSIKEDMDISIKQTEVTCYTEEKIEKLNRKISFLKYEYWAFVKKLRELNPGIGNTPWTDKPYTRRKRKLDEDSACGCAGTDKGENSAGGIQDDAKTSEMVKFAPIATPLLAGDANHHLLYGYQEVPLPCLQVNTETQDAPLQFRTGSGSCDKDDSLLTGESVSGTPQVPDSSVQDAPLQFKAIMDTCPDDVLPFPLAPPSVDKVSSSFVQEASPLCGTSDGTEGQVSIPSSVHLGVNRSVDTAVKAGQGPQSSLTGNPLQLPYSDSEESDS